VKGQGHMLIDELRLSNGDNALVWPSALPPLIIVWRVTEQCDLGCRFCEYSRHRSRSRRSTDPAAVLNFGAVLRDHAAATGRPVHVSFLGGEPLLWRPLMGVARALKHDLGLQTGLTTNGTRLMAPGVLDHLLSDYDQVTVSVDGLAGWHDACRDAPGLWQKLRDGLTTLAARKAQCGDGPLLRANTVLMRSNLLGLEALCRELAGWGVEAVTFNALGGTDGDAFYDAERLRPEHVDWLRASLPGMRERLLRLGLRLSCGAAYVDRLHRQARGQPWPVDDCRPGTQYLFVDEHGRAGPCDATTAGYGVPVSEIRTAADLADLPRRLAASRAHQRLDACADCRSTAVFGKFAEAVR
jgi:MoaA/NifB/PqqE/SkfB family radical SAM enzyme